MLNENYLDGLQLLELDNEDNNYSGADKDDYLQVNDEVNVSGVDVFDKEIYEDSIVDDESNMPSQLRSDVPSNFTNLNISTEQSDI